MNWKKIAYWISTGFVCLLMLFSATMYFIEHEAVVDAFDKLGFPGWLVYPLAIAKILAVIAILSKKSEMLKEWAYAGLFFDFLMAAGAHIMAQDNSYHLAIIALICLIASYVLDKKMYTNEPISVAG